MKYSELGRTGLRVSRLGFGAMRLPMTGAGPDATVDRQLAIPMIRRALDCGINYIDTAVGYCNADSQRVVGEAIRGQRDRVILSTKNPYYGEDEKAWWTNLENSLERLQTSWIDIYNHHGISWKAYVEQVEPRMAQWMIKARDQGLIRHICCSFHDNCEALVKLVDTGYPEAITLQYNLLDRQLEEGIAHAASRGVGVVVMGPIGGGRFGEHSDVLASVVPGTERVPELALRFVLSNAHVSTTISGMSTMAQVEDNAVTASDGRILDDSELDLVAEHFDKLKALADLYCTGCGYCMPCPTEVNIPSVLGKYNLGRVYGLWQSARERYASIGKVPWEPGVNAAACTECGECETKCPQKIPIRERLKEAHSALGSEQPDKTR